MSENIDQWAENMTKEIYLEFTKSYSFWKYGIKVFYSPVTKNPPLVIISYQPGGNEKEYLEEDQKKFKNEIFVPPDINAYIENKHKMCKKVQFLFGFEGGLKLLNESVVFPLIFFRAPSVSRWRVEMGEKRIDAENFCFSKVNEILKVLQPKKILILGIKTYDLMLEKGVIGSVHNVNIRKDSKKDKNRIIVTSECVDCKIFAMIHPTGARIAEADWSTIKQSFSEWIVTEN